MLIAVVFCGCSESESGADTAESVIVEDMLGREVTLQKEVERVVCLRAGALRMLVYLDAVSYASGIEEPERRADRPYLMARPGLRELPSIGPQMGGDAELIVASEPDLIFLTFTTVGQADDLQNRTGIPVIALEYGDFSLNRETFFGSLRLMASVLGKEERAEWLISYIRDSLQALEDRTVDITEVDRPSAYIGGVSYSGVRGISSTEPYYPPFRFVDAENVAGDIDDRLINPVEGTFIDKEQLLMWDPDVLFVDLAGWHVTRDEISSGTPLHAGLQALKEGEVYGVLPYNNYAANYENILANAWYAGKVLYAGRFSDVDMDATADDIYESFLGTPLYEEISGLWGGFRQLDRELP